MVENSEGSVPSTPESVKAVAQTNEGSDPGPTEAGSPAQSVKEGTVFVISEDLSRADEVRWHDRKSNQPLYRPLKIFALDPSISKLEGATAVVNVPYEPLKAGPIGCLFWVSGVRDDGKNDPPLLDLEDPYILISNGIEPSTWDKRFHEQMVYAVCSVVYTAFRTALGRNIAWGFKKPALEKDRVQLLIKPHAFRENLAYYDGGAGELCFGYYKNTSKDQFPENVYTCLSHDTVAHEVTHALLDGIRKHFSLPTSPDVPAFHEGFADLVAVFQHFSYEQVVRAAIRKSRGNLTRASLLTDIARQLGQTGREYKSALRSAIDHGREMEEEKKKARGAEGAASAGKKGGLRYYNPNLEKHDLGSVLVLAVFEAFVNVFRRKTERLIRIATGGSGRLPEGDLPHDLQTALAEKASKLANQFLTMCIRAVDYCPPVDVTFGEYLRAVITADKDLVPDDPWAYREAWVDAFRRYRIYPNSVPDLSEDALLWGGPDQHGFTVHKITGLTFADLQFDGDPGQPASGDELKRQARVLGHFVTQSKEYLHGFGLAVKGEDSLNGDDVELPVVQSVRSSRRIGPNGQVVFDLVAEVTQRRLARIKVKDTDVVCSFYGGSTIIIDPRGEIRYAIRKGVMNDQRLKQQIEFLAGAGEEYTDSLYGMDEPRHNFFKMLHENLSPITGEAPGPWQCEAK